MALASHKTPEQPSPRTAHSQGMFPRRRCKFHVGASAWHEMASAFYIFRTGTRPRQLPMRGYRSNLPSGYND